MERGGKKGQVTLFIVLGLILVVTIVVMSLLLTSESEPESNTPEILGPRQFIEKCVADAIEETVDKILIGGGELNPDFVVRYNKTNYTYLCYQADNYKSCYNLNPMLKSTATLELKKDTEDKVAKCFDIMEEDFKERNYDISGDAMSYELELFPGEIRVELKKEMTISKDGASQSFENFNIRIYSQLYDLMRIAKEIVNGEAKTCYFEHNGYMLLYPDYKIKMKVFEDSKLYSVSNRNFNKEFKFAVRGCARPVGFF